MQLDDLSQVAPIIPKNETSWNIKAIENSLNHYQCFVLQQRGRVIGFSIISTVLDEAELLYIAIAPAFRYKGWGSKFLASLIERFTANRIKKVFLEVRISNILARALYKKHGFIKLACNKGYYRVLIGTEREDAVVMVLLIC